MNGEEYRIHVGCVAELVGNEGGAESGVINLGSSKVETPEWRPHHTTINATTNSNSSQPATEIAVGLFDNWLDPIETKVCSRACGFIDAMILGEPCLVKSENRLRDVERTLACSFAEEPIVGLILHGRALRVRNAPFSTIIQAIG